MGKRKYPPLKRSEVVEIVLALGFAYKRTSGSHYHYERPAKGSMDRKLVTVDMGKAEFTEFLIKSMVSQSGFSCECFYGATKSTAKKASVPLFVVDAA